MKSIALPIQWVVDDVLCDSLKRFVVTDYVIMKARLPSEIKSRLVSLFGYRRFVSTYDG